MTDQLPALSSPTRTTARMRAAHPVPALVAASGDRAFLRFLEFFAANIRNPHTRRAYGRAVADFLVWCDDQGRFASRSAYGPRAMGGRGSSELMHPVRLIVMPSGVI